jgi:hypothetical protein
MVAAKPGTTFALVRHALAGLEAGVLGSLVFCGWLMVGSVWLRHSIWAGPNLFAVVVRGPEAYTNAFQPATATGFAFILLLYGSLGVLWGILWRDRQSSFLRLIGALTGLAVYFLFFHGIWPRISPMLVLYAPLRQLQIAHILWGIVLAGSPRFSRKIALATGELAPSAASPAYSPEPIARGEITL